MILSGKINNFISAFRESFHLARKRQEPQRDTIVYPMSNGYGRATNRVNLKPNSANLRYFSRTPYVRSAINSIKNPILETGWEIRTKKGIELNSELKRQIEVATSCFAHPNHDDSFNSLIGAILEDYLVIGAGCIEHQLSNNTDRPVWMWSTDAQSINIFNGWSGKSSEARYMQSLGDTSFGLTPNNSILLRNDELVYIKSNASNDTPYGTSAVSMAFDSISRQLGAGRYAGNKASNAQPENALWIKGSDIKTLERVRQWWRNTIEGEGQTPIFGSADEPKAIKMHGGTDAALYLEWQEFLIKEIATAFGLTPMNLGVEHDVNRSTAEVSEERDYAKVIRPISHQIAEHLTREVLHSKLGWYSLEFFFTGLDREDQLVAAQIYEKDYKNNLITPNEERARRGLPPSDNYLSDRLYTECEIEIAAARGAQLMLDKNLADDANQDRQNQSKFNENDKQN